MFQLLHPTRATLTTFTGRTEVHGKDRVPAVSFRLRFSGPNTLLDLLSPTLRPAVYTAAEGQEDLPGVEPATPLLRSKDVKHLTLESISYEGWTVHVEHGIDDSSTLKMGSAKIDAFAVDFHDGGTVEIECRVSTSDIDAEGAGLLWAKQTREVPVVFIAPKTLETNPESETIDGTKGHPGLFDGPDDDQVDSEGGEQDATDAFVAAHAETPAATRGEPAWPFPPGHGGGAHVRSLAPLQAEPEAQREVAKTPAARKSKKVSAPAKGRIAKYRDAMTGSTWSGRGLKPKWLTVQLDAGKALSDFAV